MELLNPLEKERWYKENAEHLRYQYDLNENSTVIDIGACIGDFIEGIYHKYNCNIIGYEPVKYFYDKCVSKFSNPKIKVYNLGVSNKNIENTVFGYDNIENECKSLDIKDAITTKIDLLKINIEGGEYDLLDRLLKTNIKLVNNIQVQFHMNIENFEKRRAEIHKKLSKTHKLDWSYDFVWESWSLK